MKSFFGIAVRALLIFVAFGLVGLAVNAFSSKPLPIIYIPPQEIVISGITVQLIDSNKAKELHDDSMTRFIDTRKPEDYAEARIKGSLFINPDTIDEDLPKVEPLLNPLNTLILYCYGPECDMAERVAAVLSTLGHEKMKIMTSGFRAWDQAGFPVDKGKKDARQPGSRD